MSKCELTVELSNASKEFQFGELIRGRVHVRVDRECQCDKLTLDLFWRTHGMGNKDTGSQLTKTLFQGEWSPGDFYYDFEFQVPDGPRTYIGDAINIDWYLVARADIPWAIDPKAELGLTVKPSDRFTHNRNVPSYDFRSNADLSVSFDRKSNSPLGTTLFAIPLVFAAGFFVYSLVKMNILWILFSGFALYAFASAFKPWIKRYVAAKKLGNVSLTINQDHFRAGDDVTFRLHFSPIADIDIGNIEAHLVFIETAVSGSGTNTQTHTRKSNHGELKLHGPFRCYTGRRFEKSGSIRIPEQAMHCFQSDNNSLLWHLNVSIDIPNWPDWEKSESIQVSA